MCRVTEQLCKVTIAVVLILDLEIFARKVFNLIKFVTKYAEPSKLNPYSK